MSMLITMDTGLFIFLLLLAFIAGLLVSFFSCKHAADTVYTEAEQEQDKRFTSNMNKFLS